MTHGPDEIQLSQIAAAVWRRKGTVGVAALLAAVVTFAAGHFVADRYTSQALLAIAPPEIVGAAGYANLAELLPSASDMRNLAELPSTIRGVRRAAIERGVLDADRSMDDLERGMSSRRAASRLVHLQVTHKDPEVAQALTRLWAEQIVHVSQELYLMSLEDLDEQDRRLRQAGEQLDEAQARLTEILPEARLEARQQRIDALQTRLRRQLVRRDHLDNLGRDARAVRDRLGQASSPSRRLQVGEAMALAALQSSIAASLDGVQLHLAADDRPDVAQAREALAQLIASFRQQTAELDEQADTLEARLTELTQEHETYRHRQTLLTRERDEAQQFYAAMYRAKLQSRVLLATERSPMIRVTRDATLPDRPDHLPRLLLTVGVTVAVTLLACGWVLLKPGGTSEKPQHR